MEGLDLIETYEKHFKDGPDFFQEEPVRVVPLTRYDADCLIVKRRPEHDDVHPYIAVLIFNQAQAYKSMGQSTEEAAIANLEKCIEQCRGVRRFIEPLLPELR